MASENAPMFSVSGKAVVVTGAGRGNGRAIANGFLAAGARVLFVDKSVEMASAPGAHGLVCDLTRTDAPKTVCDAAVARLGGLDVLVNCAGISLTAADPYENDQVWDQTLDINLKAAFRLSGAAADVMKRQRRGSIINITSLGAELGFPNNPSYVAAKGGLRLLTKAMARDWAKFNIRVNSVCPGYIYTDMTKASHDDPVLHEERRKRTMLGRWGMPEDLVGPCIFLASDAASYITGCDLAVDGGWLANGL